MKVRRFIAFTVFWLFGLVSISLADGDPVFVEQEVSKNSVYVGEQTLYNFTLNTQTSVFNYQPPELALENAWSEVIAVNQRYRRTIENRVWMAYSNRRAIYPLAPGQITIPKLSIPVGIRVRSRRRVPAPFDFGDALNDEFLEQFFAEVEPKTVTLYASGITIDVKPLPPVPAGFPPAVNGYIPVGATSVSARVSRQQLEVGESVTLEVSIVSVGNLNPLSELNPRVPPRVRIYPEVAKSTQNENNAALIMRKTFRYSLVPVTPGNFQLGSLQIPYFDPEASAFRVAETPEFQIRVSGAALTTEPVSPALTTPESTPAKPDSTPTPVSLGTEADEKPAIIGRRISGEMVMLALTVAILALFLLLYLLLLQRRKRSFKLFREKLSRIESLAELSELYRTMLVERLGARHALYTYEELIVLLKRASFDTNLEFLALNLLDGLEQARFSPGFDETTQLDPLKSETLRVVSGMLEQAQREKPLK